MGQENNRRPKIYKSDTLFLLFLCIFSIKCHFDRRTADALAIASEAEKSPVYCDPRSVTFFTMLQQLYSIAAEKGADARLDEKYRRRVLLVRNCGILKSVNEADTPLFPTTDSVFY